MASALYLVFPAGAGMNRCSAVTSFSILRVPRRCGDEPDSDVGRGGATVCSPQVRG